ncbi:pancreatic triacylglycerol lipase-like [Branchiostoma lanceolatum]|uniref:pancreatic triacylglycerol lipase-like n=1 Tax=Branchiostoma lanceolatum TaxID=7740 RepID=UPI003453747A
MQRLPLFVFFSLMAATGEMLAMSEGRLGRSWFFGYFGSVDVKYYLHTRENLGKPTVLGGNNPNVSQTPYRPDRPTKFIIHGFWSQGDSQWIVNMANALLQEEDLNVFAVDWSYDAGPGVTGANYLVAASNCLEVGRIVGEFVTELGQAPDKTHVIGHSLGAHAAGFAGKTTKSQGLTVARISGLDPAGPLFRGTIDANRLDRSDATFVDVIHTEKHHLGLPEPVGHVDFYPNEGWKQPGCKGIAWILPGYGRKKMRGSSVIPLDSCSHGRAYEFYTESINSSCQFLAYRCQDWDTFNRRWEQCDVCGHSGQDNRVCSEMGYRSKNYPNSHGSMYLVTSKDPPPHWHCSVSGIHDTEATQSDQCVQNVSPDLRQEIRNFMDSMTDIQQMGLEEDFCRMYSDMEAIVANITAPVSNCGPEDVPDILEYIADAKFDAVLAWVSTSDGGFTLPSATLVIGLQLIVACVTQALPVRG